MVSGYSGGHVKNPTYKQVSSGRTGHAEVVQMTFDPNQISYAELLEVFWKTHDPTTPNQGLRKLLMAGDLRSASLPPAAAEPHSVMLGSVTLHIINREIGSTYRRCISSPRPKRECIARALKAERGLFRTPIPKRWSSWSSA